MNEDREMSMSKQLCEFNQIALRIQISIRSLDRASQILDVCDRFAIQNIHVIPIKIMILDDLVIAE